MNNLNVISESGIVEQVTPHQVTADNLAAQVGRVIIDSEEVLANAGDLKKVIKVQLKKIDESRRVIVDPLNKHVKFINAQYKPYTDQLKETEKLLTGKMNVFAAEQYRIREAEEKAARDAAEAEAMERAVQAEARGDNEVAEAVLEQAATYDKAPTKAPIARGNLGSSTSVRKVIKFEIASMKELCKAIGEGKVSAYAVMPNEVWIRQGITKKKAEDNGKAELLGDGYMPGVRFYEDITTAVR